MKMPSFDENVRRVIKEMNLDFATKYSEEELKDGGLPDPWTTMEWLMRTINPPWPSSYSEFKTMMYGLKPQLLFQIRGGAKKLKWDPQDLE